MPWALWSLMMWNFKIDITFNEDGRGYGDYHAFWQIMGFVYPFIGLLCFFIPVCLTPEPEKRIKRNFADFAMESDSAYEAEEQAYRENLKAAKKQIDTALANVNA